jgi:Ca-activated chloride channel family protein
MNIEPNDPKLTAFAFGELDGEEAAQVQKMLDQPGSEDARRLVAQIRSAGTMLEQALKEEPAPALTDEQRQRIASPPPIAGPAIFTWGRAAALAAGVVLVVALLGLLVPGLVNSRGSIEMARRTDGDGPAPTDEATKFAFEAPLVAGAPAQEVRVVEGGKTDLFYAMPPKPREAGPKAVVGSVNTPSALQNSADGAIVGSQADVYGGSVMPQAPSASVSGPELALRARPDARGGGFRRSGSRGGSRLGALIPESQVVLEQPMPIGDVAAEEWNREQYDHLPHNPFIRPSDQGLSTFSIDVDTASYTNMRRFIESGAMPPPGAVRIEEFINYFRYDYEPPSQDHEHPFSVNVEVSQAPWAPAHRLVRIGVKGREVQVDDRPATNLVFLLDVSGSMNEADKLPLVKEGMKRLVNRLNTDDRIAIVVYAGAAGLVLPSTYGYERDAILDAIERLQAGGSTAGGQGIELAYDVVAEHFIEGGVNRVILCTDGDFNIGISDDDSLVRLIEEKRQTGAFLSVFGFGRGNLQDAKMEKLSGHGNGTYGYIDSKREADRVFVQDLSGTLVTIAKDVKLQVDFNPAKVAAYRLIGYENRLLAAQDFNDDTKDAGEIGAGHTVTALYEIVPVGDELDLPVVEGSKYVEPSAPLDQGSDELLTVRVRYKAPDGEQSTRFDYPVIDSGADLEQASNDFRFAAALAGYGMILRQSPHLGDTDFQMVLDLAQSGITPVEDPESADGREMQRRQEFAELVEKAKTIQ